MRGNIRRKDVHPPLPERLQEESRRAQTGGPLLADGCYFLAFGLLDTANVLGTLWVESHSGRLFVSGDLYDFEPGKDDKPVGEIPPRGDGIPIFPIADYRHYMRVMKIEPADGGFVLTFEAHLFIPKVNGALDGSDTPPWRFEATYIARMMRAEAPSGYPSPGMFFVGDVSTPDELSMAGHMIGKMQLGWMSPALRRAVIEIDRVAESESPENNGAGVSWKSIFDPIGWEVTTIVSDGIVMKYGGPAWTVDEGHAAMLAYRDKSDLDAEWRYHILAVQQIAFSGGERGIMYDHNGFNGVPREGLLLASHYIFPEDEPRWGALRGARAGETVAFFRTAVHEIGHAMGLDHSPGFGFMRPTDGIAESAPADMPFPSNIVWAFAPDDEHLLRHLPDIIVRPGGPDMGVGILSPLPAD
jgi:Matrixin